MSFSLELKSTLKSQYTDNLANSFYNKVLSEANLYQRVSGYFSSAGVDLYAEGLEELAKNGGKVQFVISKEISKEDYNRIKEGYDLREELKKLRIAEQNERLTLEVQRRLGNLAFMIANGRAEVKVALSEKGSFHDKFGLIYSGDEIVFFNGSANETKNGISENYESISVDVSWDSSDNVQSRIKENKERFMRLWSNIEEGVQVIEASELTYEEIAPYQSLSTITTMPQIGDSFQEELGKETISFLIINQRVVRVDKTTCCLTNTDRKLKNGSDLTKFFEDDNSTICQGVTHRDLENIIKVTEQRAQRKNIEVYVSEAVQEFIKRNKYSIEQYRIMGEVYKNDIDKFPVNRIETYHVFSKIVQSEVARPLKENHLRAAYFEYEMMRAANFSVPGAGKTAMLLGVFAYLNRFNAPVEEKVKRILVISPISAFDSWKREFKVVFGDKKILRVIDSQNSQFDNLLDTDWGVSNLVLVNYESLPKHFSKLKKLTTYDTMLVYDEVHRVKNPNGRRAKYALELSVNAKFRYVLTGTPIPNKYSDIYNLLNILYGNEYNSYFGWDISELNNPKIRKIKEINESIHPFFWRTNKKDLNVPEAEADEVYVVEPSKGQMALAEAIYNNERSSLAKLIRLVQASTNPSLVNMAIDYDELMSFDDDDDKLERISGIDKKQFDELLGEDSNVMSNQKYTDFDLNNMVSPKFEKGIQLVTHLVSQGKKVLVWGIFVDTIVKISKALEANNIKVNLVYGATPKYERVELINEFRDGSAQVLVSNPQTLGESISLHQTVHDAVYFEYDFNLTHMLQSRDRIHRLGLEDNQYTQYYYLQTRDESSFSDRPGFIDEKIYERLKDKEQVMYDAIDNHELFIEFSEDEILDAIHIIDEERNRIVSNGKR